MTSLIIFLLVVHIITWIIIVSGVVYYDVSRGIDVGLSDFIFTVIAAGIPIVNLILLDDVVSFLYEKFNEIKIFKGIK